MYGQSQPVSMTTERHLQSVRLMLPFFLQAAEGSGGAALRSGGEGEGGGGAEERNRLGQEGGPSPEGTSGGSRERKEPADIRGAGAGAGSPAGAAPSAEGHVGKP